MASSYTRRINLYINGTEVKNDIGSIEKEMRKLINDQRRMTYGGEEYEAQFKKIANLKTIVDKHRAEIRNIGKSWTQLASEKITKYWGIAAAGAASMAGTVMAFKNAADASNAFEERLDNLSALTGLSGADLKWLGDTALDTSTKITEGGVRIKQSADDIVDAYTKVGSQRPELLKNKEALAAVTEDAITLSEAAKMDLDPAVKGLTTTMNQFNLPASESRRIINAMAAGSKEGAADIPYLTDAIEKSGTTMSLMNVSLEENIGLIESIAPYYAEASQAGNSLDKVFLKLKEKQIGYVNGTFDLNTALNELKTRFNNGESAASLFGVEHAKMGELLVQNKDEFNRYTEAVTGTNVAIEQASKNTNNQTAMLEQARNEFHKATIVLGDQLSPAMTFIYQLGGRVANSFSEMIRNSPADSLRQQRDEINGLVVELRSSNTQEERREQILLRLKEVAPELAKTITDEKSNLEDLTTAVAAYNKEMSLKILIAEGDTSVAKQTAKVNSLQRLAAKSEANLAVSMKNSLSWFEEKAPEVKATAEEILYDTNKSIQQKAEELNKLALDNTTLGNSALFGALDSYRIFRKNYTDELFNLDILIADTDKKKKEWEKVYGSNNGNDTPDPIPVSNPNSNQTPLAGQNKDALDALELAHAEQILSIKQFYADKENLQKEANARMLAADIAYLQAKAALEADDTKRVAIQSQIIDTQQKYTSALKEAIPEIINTDNAVKKFNNRQLEFGKLMTYASQKQQEGTESSSEYQAAQLRSAQTVQMVGNTITGFVSDAINGSLGEYATFGDYLILMSLQILKQMVPIWSAQILGYSLASPESVLTWGAAGMAKYALITGIMYTAISAVEASVKSGINKRSENAKSGSTRGYASGGFTQGEGLYLAGEKNKTEWISPNWMVTNPVTGPIISGLEAFRNRPNSVDPLAIAATASQSTSISSRSGVSESTVSGSNSTTIIQQNDPELKAMLNSLMYRLDNPVAPELPIAGRNGVVQRIKDYNNIKSKVSRKNS